MKKEKFTIRPAVFVVLKKDDRVFLLRRANTGYADGMYTFPSGHVEEGEMPLDAAVREAKEETGVAVRKEDLRFVHTCYCVQEVPYVYFFFVAEHWDGEPTNLEVDKCDLADWFALDALPDTTLPYVKSVLEGYAQGIAFSEFQDVPYS